MNLPVILDIAIGLVFIYLVASLLASEIQELLAAVLQWRAKHLKESIQNLLSGGYGTQDSDRVNGFVEAIYNDPLMKNVNQSSRGLIGQLGQAVYQLVYGRNKIFGANKTAPSYISSETFATSLLDQVGMASLIDKLTEIRLEKFISRIVGLYTVQETADPGNDTVKRTILIPSAQEFEQKDNWEKGGIRVLAEKAAALAQDSHITGATASAILALDNSNPDFIALVEEYDDLLMDFKAGQVNVQTCVERMQEGLELFINQIGEKILTADPKAAESNSEASQQQDFETKQLDYFQKRLKALNLSTFGENSTRAISSGKLRPNLLEIAEVFDRSSMTYEEIEKAFRDAKAAYEAGMKPETVQPVLAAIAAQVNDRVRARTTTDASGAVADPFPFYQPIAIADLLTDQYQSDVEEVLRTLTPKEQEVYQQTYRGWKQYQQIILKVIQDIADQLQNKASSLDSNASGHLFNLRDQLLIPRPPQDENRIPARERDKYVVKRWQDLDSRTLATYVKYSLSKLFDEERQMCVNAALNTLSLDQRKIYTNYQTYDQIQDFLSRVPPQVKQSLAILARRAYVKVQETDKQLNQFREEVSVWFDRSMSRASGVYKRNAKLVAIVLGVLIALVINIDTLHIISRLSNDQSLRQVIVQRADEITQQTASNTPTPVAAPSPPSETTPSPLAPPATNSLPATPGQTGENQLKKQLGEIRQATDAALQDVALPIQWSPVNLRQQFECNPDATDMSWEQFRKDCRLNEIARKSFWSIPRVALGWLISGLAIAMGAPFWFDLLSKVMNVRNTGSRPASTTDKQNSNPPT